MASGVLLQLSFLVKRWRGGLDAQRRGMAHGSKAGPTSRRQLSWQSAGRDWTRRANGSCRQEASFSWRPLSDFSPPERVCRSVSTREPPRGWTLKKTTGLGGSSVLAGIVSKADTPMARLLRDKPGSVKLRGAGKRVSTFCSQIRAVRKYAVWLASASSVPCQMRLTEPSGRAAIKGAHLAMVFFEEICGVRHGALDCVRDLSSCKEGDPRGGSAGSKTEASYEVPNSCACSAEGAGRKRGSTSSVLGLCATLAPLRDRSGRRVTEPPRIQSQAAASEDDRGRQKSHLASGRSRLCMLRAEREVGGNRLAAYESKSSFRKVRFTPLTLEQLPAVQNEGVEVPHSVGSPVQTRILATLSFG